MKLCVGDRVVHIGMDIKGVVVEVNDKYGWFVVLWDNNRRREYNGYTGTKQTVMLDTDSVVT